jgi:hypothetical protein
MVTLRDAIPPLVVSASYKGDTIEVVFDKPVDIDQIDAADLATALNIAGANNFNLDLNNTDDYSVSGNTLTINYDAYGDLGFALTSVFDQAQYNEASLADDVSTDATLYAHATLDFGKIPNSGGFTWDAFVAAEEDGGYIAPNFAIVSDVEDFAFNGTHVNNAAVNQSITLRLDFSHRIDSAALETAIDTAGDGDGNVDPDDIEAILAFTDNSGGGVGIDLTGSHSLTVTNNADGTVRFSFVVFMDNADVVNGDSYDFTFGAVINSEWDNSQLNNYTLTLQ